MRRTRRLLTHPVAIVAALCLVAAGCGGSDGGGGDGNGGGGSALPTCPVDALSKASGPVEVVLWHSWVGRTAATLQAIADKYNAGQSKVKVTIQNQGANYEELRRNYEQALGAKQLPAIVAGEDTWTQFMVDNGATLPAQACIEQDKDSRARIDDLLPAVKAAYSVKDVQWPAAFAVSTPVLYFNRTAFTRAGLDPAKPPATLAEVRTAAEKLKAAGEGAGGPMAMKMDPWYIEHLATGAKEAVIDNDNGRNGNRANASSLTGPRVSAVTDWLSQMAGAGLLNPVKNSSQIDHYLAVATQRSSMLFETSTAITLIAGVVQGGLDLKKELGDAAGGINIPPGFKVGFEVGVAPYPGIDQAGRGQVGGGALYLSNTGSPEVQAAAWDFLKFFNQVDNQVEWTRNGSYLPVRKAAAEQLESDQAWKSSLVGGWITVAYNQMTTLDASFPGPLLGAYDSFRKELGNAMESITIQKTPPATAIGAAVPAIDAAIKKYNDTSF